MGWRVSMNRRNQDACVGSNNCSLGCPTGAKASTDLTYWPKALAAGARLVTRARVREITLGPDGRAAGAVYYDGEGRECEQRARAVVLAANGIGTPRLLLMNRAALPGLSPATGKRVSGNGDALAMIRDAPAALQIPTAKMPIGPQPVTSTVAPGTSVFVSAVWNALPIGSWMPPIS